MEGIAPIMTATGANLPKYYANAINQMNKGEKYCPMQHQLVINENKHKPDNLFHNQYSVHCVISIKESRSKQSSRN